MKVEYKHTPPQVIVSRINCMVQESQLPRWKVQLRWVQIKDDEPQSHSADNETQQGSTGSYISESVHTEAQYNIIAATFIFS